MATASKINCGPCHVENLTKEADVWCIECEEGLCQECMNFHKRMKYSRNHKTVGVSSYEGNKRLISNISLQCENHEEVLDLFCPNHLIPCCAKCVSTDHSNCVGIISLQSAIKNETLNSKCEDLQNTLEITHLDFKNLISNRKSNLEMIKQQKDKIKQYFVNFREELLTKFDNLQREALSELTPFENNEEQNIRNLVTELESREIEIDKMKETEKIIVECASVEQAFVKKLNIRENISKQQQYLSDILEGEALLETAIMCEEKATVSSIFSDVNSLLNININKTKPDVKLATVSHSNVIAQTASGYLPNLKDIQLEYEGQIDIPYTAYLFGRNVSNVVNISSSRLAMCDSNSELFVLDHRKMVLEDCDVSGSPWDVVLIDDTTLAATYPQESVIKLVSADSFLHIKSLGLTGKGRGLCFTGKRLVVGVNGKEIQFLDLDGQINWSFSVEERGSVGLSYLHFDNGHIYCSDYQTHTLQCFDVKGNIVWEFQNQCFLKSPRGICSDQYGNIFVVGLESNNIVSITRNGNFGEELCNLSNEVKKPKCICFNKINQRLYISNETGETIAVYQVIYYK